MLNVIYAECLKYDLYAECRYAECRGAVMNTLLQSTPAQRIILMAGVA
jgi:hypothetical protein